MSDCRFSCSANLQNLCWLSIWTSFATEPHAPDRYVATENEESRKTAGTHVLGITQFQYCRDAEHRTVLSSDECLRRIGVRSQFGPLTRGLRTEAEWGWVPYTNGTDCRTPNTE